MALRTLFRGSRAAIPALSLLVLTSCGHDPVPTPPSPPPSVAPPSVPAKTTAPPDREPHTLVLNATGTAKVTSVRYTLDGQVVQDGAVTLPWRAPVIVPADGHPHSWTLDVGFTGNGEVDLVAIFDGQVAGQGSSAGSGNTKGDAYVGGTVNG